MPQPAAAAYPESVNPFAIAGGFTVYAREDALLQNQETEGSIAVGGTATVQARSASQYTIIHVVRRHRRLRPADGRRRPDALPRRPVQHREHRHPGDHQRRHDRARAAGRPQDGAARRRLAGVHARRLAAPEPEPGQPGSDAAHRRHASAVPGGRRAPGTVRPATTASTPSNTSATAVADYVEANRDASWEAGQHAASTTSPTPPRASATRSRWPRTSGDRVVLEPLSPDQPNIVDYADIAGTALIQFSPGPTPGVSNPLVIRVPAGTTEVIGARADPQGAYSPYIIWDLSQLTGDVTVTAAQATHRRLDLRARRLRHRERRPAGRSGDRPERHPAGRRGALVPVLRRDLVHRRQRHVRRPQGAVGHRRRPICPTAPRSPSTTRDRRSRRQRHSSGRSRCRPTARPSPPASSSRSAPSSTFDEIAPESVPGWEWGDGDHRARTRSRSAPAPPTSS